MKTTAEATPTIPDYTQTQEQWIEKLKKNTKVMITQW